MCTLIRSSQLSQHNLGCFHVIRRLLYIRLATIFSEFVFCLAIGTYLLVMYWHYPNFVNASQTPTSSYETQRRAPSLRRDPSESVTKPTPSNFKACPKPWLKAESEKSRLYERYFFVCVHEDTLQHYMNIRNSEANEMKEKRTSVRDGCRKRTKIKVARKHIRRTWGQWIKRLMSHFILATGWLLHCANMCTRIYIHKQVCILLRYMCILLCYGLLAYVLAQVFLNHTKCADTSTGFVPSQPR